MPAAAQSSPSVVVLAGPARSGKTYELVKTYGGLLSKSASATKANPIGGQLRWPNQLWLAPTARAAAAVRDALVDFGVEACLAPGVSTFALLATRLIRDSGRKVRLLAPVAERELLRRVVSVAQTNGTLTFFAEAARRSGFIDSLRDHVGELKRRDIGPAAYARIAAARGAERHIELARLYADYVSLCTEHELVDTEGRYALARDLVGDKNLPPSTDRLPPSSPDLIVVDGFTDFTRIQLELLARLARGAREVWISLPLDEPGRDASTATRTDLFAKSAATLSELKTHFPNIEVRHLPARGGATPVLDHLARHVFRFPHPAPPAEVLASLDRVEIIQAASAQDEIVQLARRIKARLAAGDRPGDMLVTFRSLADPQRIEDVFGQYGIPYSLEAAPRLARAPVFKTLAALLQLDADDWPFRRLVSVITNNTLAAMPDDARRAADWLVRDLQIAKGRHRLLEVVTGLAAQEASADQFSDHYRRRIAAAVAARLALEQLAAALDRLPTASTASAWTRALEQLGTELGLPPKTWEGEAWQAIARHFAELEQLGASIGEQPQQLDRRAALALLVDVATQEALPRRFDEAGCVKILAASTARGIAARHLFLAGLSEQAFPTPGPTGQLASEAEYKFFTRAAHQQEGTGDSGQRTEDQGATHSQEEMLLFYEVLSRAEESLTLSYPAMDEKAQELPPSPYVVELQRLFRASGRHIRTVEPQLSPVCLSAERPKTESGAPAECDSIRSPLCLADWRIQAVAEALGPTGDVRLLAGLFSQAAVRPLADSIDAGIRIVHARARGEEFGPSEGLLQSPLALAALTKRFGPQHSWSPSQLETYAACPYKFFLENVLKLQPLGDLVLETDSARRGSLFHEVLAAFHRKFCESTGGEWAALWNDAARFADELRSILEAAVGVPRVGIEGALIELDRRQIMKWTAGYYGQHEKYSKAWKNIDEPPRPAHFELRFGKKHAGEAGDEDPNSVDLVYRLDIGGETIQVSGRIDRIDVGRAGGKKVFNVIDYKSGKRPTLSRDKIESGERLQPALYAMAAEAVLFAGEGAVPLWAGYWSMQQGVTTQERSSLHCAAPNGDPTETWEQLRPKVVARIGEIVRGARRGDFPVDSKDEDCTRLCDFRTVCRVAQVRSVGKVWPPGNESSSPPQHQPEA